MSVELDGHVWGAAVTDADERAILAGCVSPDELPEVQKRIYRELDMLNPRRIGTIGQQEEYTLLAAEKSMTIKIIDLFIADFKREPTE